MWKLFESSYVYRKSKKNIIFSSAFLNNSNILRYLRLFTVSIHPSCIVIKHELKRNNWNLGPPLLQNFTTRNDQYLDIFLKCSICSGTFIKFFKFAKSENEISCEARVNRKIVRKKKKTRFRFWFLYASFEWRKARIRFDVLNILESPFDLELQKIQCISERLLSLSLSPTDSIAFGIGRREIFNSKFGDISNFRTLRLCIVGWLCSAV